jgi:hypothetical protein
VFTTSLAICLRIILAGGQNAGTFVNQLERSCEPNLLYRERWRLAAKINPNMTGQDFASALERAIQRGANPPLMIEAKIVENSET